MCKNVDASIKDLVRRIGVDIWTFSDLGILESKIVNVEEKSQLLKLSPVEQKAYFALLKRGSIIARAEDLSSMLDVSAVWANNILSKLARKGVAQRVGRGKYIVIPADIVYGRKSYVADPLVLISELLNGTEYYVAYYSAAYVHGLTEQLPFKTTVAVPKQIRSIRVGNISVDFVTLKKSRFFGYQEIRYSDATFNVSDIEKTLIDSVDRPELCGGIPEVVRIMSNAFETGHLNQRKLASYVKKFDSHAVAHRLGFIMEYLQARKKMQVEPDISNDLLSLVGSKVYPFNSKVAKPNIR